MADRLRGTRIIVTGASRGVGRAVSEAFAAEGATLVLTATDVAHLGAVLDACARRGAAAEPVALDLGRPRRPSRAAAGAAIAALGRVDVLVNNAAILGVRALLADYPMDLWERVMRVNVEGTLRLIQRVLPAMAEGGAIVNVTSGAAGRPTWGAYAISKLAIDGITGMLREELDDRGLRIVAVNPGRLRTAMRAAAHPDEDPATLPHPSSVVAAFVAIAAGADPGPHVEAARWPG